jgi:hypothetical protein
MVLKNKDLVLYKNYSYTISLWCSWKKCHRKFCRKYPDSIVPSEVLHHNKIMFYGFSAVRKKKSWKEVLTEEKFCDIGTLLEGSQVVVCLALQCLLVKGRAHVGPKLLKLQPYKITVIHNLLIPDCKERIRYSRWFQESAIQLTSWPRTYVLFQQGVVHFKWLHKRSKYRAVEHRKSLCCSLKC